MYLHQLRVGWSLRIKRPRTWWFDTTGNTSTRKASCCNCINTTATEILYSFFLSEVVFLCTAAMFVHSLPIKSTIRLARDTIRRHSCSWYMIRLSDLLRLKAWVGKLLPLLYCIRSRALPLRLFCGRPVSFRYTPSRTCRSASEVPSLQSPRWRLAVPFLTVLSPPHALTVPFSPPHALTVPFSPPLAPTFPFSPPHALTVPFSPPLAPTFPFSPPHAPTVPFSPPLAPTFPYLSDRNPLWTPSDLTSSFSAMRWRHGVSLPQVPDCNKSIRLCTNYWAVQRSWFARVNALCNLSCKKSWEVAAHFRADFWVGVASRCV